jgi:hypothetical protein
MGKRKNKDNDFFNGFTESIRARTEKTVEEMAKELKKEVKKNTSLDDHSLADLRSLGYPYAKKEFSKSTSKSLLGHNTVLVHKQGGKDSSHLSDNIEIFETNRKDTLAVGVDSNKVPYVDYIIHGTEKMIARDFLAFSLLQMNKRFKKLVKKLEKGNQKIRDKV